MDEQKKELNDVLVKPLKENLTSSLIKFFKSNQ
jgi:hypothetical protein